MSSPPPSKSTVDQAKSIFVEHVTEVGTITKDAALSGGWSYPLLGIYYFVSHPALYRSFAPVILKLLLSSVAITAGLFLFTYLPQVAFCALFSGPFAFVTAAVMVFGEAYAMILLVSKTFFLAKAQDRVFDAVLIQQGNELLVSRGRPITTSGSGGMKKLGQSFLRPLNRFSKEGILRYLVSLPLNAIPGVGTVLFLLYNGAKAGPSFHARYFQLKQYDAARRNAFVEKRKGAYTAFGTTALALNLIPVVGLFFGFTSTVGAALWASELEKRKEQGKPTTGKDGAKPVDQNAEVQIEL